MRGYALGTSADSTDTTTACYVSIDSAATYITDAVNALFALSASTWMNPVVYFSQYLVEQSNSYSACTSETFIKQFDTRFSSWSGLFDMAFTVTYSYFMKTSFYTAINTIATSASCGDLGIGIGALIQITFNY